MNKKYPNDWKLDDGRMIRLLTPDELKLLPNATVIIAIDGIARQKYEEDKPAPDDNTRFGYTAWGVDVSHEYNT